MLLRETYYMLRYNRSLGDGGGGADLTGKSNYTEPDVISAIFASCVVGITLGSFIIVKEL